MTKRYRGRRHQEGRAKQLCRLSSSAGAAVVAARQPLEVSKKHGKIFEDLEEFHVLHFSSLWRFHLISSFSPHGAAPSSRGTARCGGRWLVREAVHRCRRRCRRLQQLQQLQQLGLRFVKNSVSHWHDRSQTEESHHEIWAEHYQQKISNLSHYSLYIYPFLRWSIQDLSRSKVSPSLSSLRSFHKAPCRKSQRNNAPKS